MLYTLVSIDHFVNRHLDIKNLRGLCKYKQDLTDLERDLKYFLFEDALPENIKNDIKHIKHSVDRLTQIINHNSISNQKIFTDISTVISNHFHDGVDPGIVVDTVHTALDIIDISKKINNSVDQNQFAVKKQQVYSRIINHSDKATEYNYFDYSAIADLLLSINSNENISSVVQKRQSLFQYESVFEEKLKQHICSLFDGLQITKDKFEILEHAAEFFEEFIACANDLNTIGKQLRESIKKQRKSVILESQKNHNINANTHELAIDDEISKSLSALIGKHINWQYPSAHFLPNSKSLARKIIAGDPVYVFHDEADRYTDLLSEFHKASHSKIHFYRYSNIKKFPANSIGTILAWSAFVNTDLKNTAKAFSVISDKLLPGGTVITVFNDVDTDQGAWLSDCKGYYPFTAELFRTSASNYGLAVDSASTFSEHGLTVVVLKKPGEPKTLNLVNKLALVVEDADTELKRKEEEKRFKNQKIAQQGLEKLLSEETVSDIVTRFHKIAKDCQISPDNQQEFLSQYYRNHSQSLEAKQADLGISHPTAVKLLTRVAKILLMMGDHKSARQLLNRHKKEIFRYTDLNHNAKKIFQDWHHYLNNI